MPLFFRNPAGSSESHQTDCESKGNQNFFSSTYDPPTPFGENREREKEQEEGSHCV